jgi:hypothetical protein
MTLRPLALSGMILLTTGIPDIAAAADRTLYERLQTVTQKDIGSAIDGEIADFVAAVLNDSEQTVTENDVRKAAEGSFSTVCAERSLEYAACENLRQKILSLVERERRIRTIGRDLFASAGGYEMPTSEHLGKVLSLPPAIASLLKVWQSGIDRSLSPSTGGTPRAAPMPSGAESRYSALERALRELVEEPGEKERIEELAGAVTRYRFGHRVIRKGEPCPADEEALDNELARLSKRWCAVEEKLDQIWQFLTASLANIVPPVRPGETVFFPTWIYRDMNVVVWATSLDAGLEWEIPLEPVLPELVDDRAFDQCMDEVGDEPYCHSIHPRTFFLGGEYLPPPETPGKGIGICGLPMNTKGFLCRPIAQTECQKAYDISTNAFYLGGCIDSVLDEGISERQPDDPPPVIDTPQRQQDIRPPPCSRCAVDLYCAAQCPGGGGSTEPKDARGVIPLCIPESINGKTAVLQSLILHELVHVQQTCSNPREILDSDLQRCCAAEYQAYHVQCAALAEDGILQDMEIGGRRGWVTPELCAATGANGSCREQGKCSDSPIDYQEFVQAMAVAAEENKERLQLPESCASAILDLDERAKAMVRSLPTVCSPKCKTKFESTIGNNLCFIGQCLEQSWEEERLVPGRMTLNANDESFPWDSCVGGEPAASPIAPSIGSLTLPSLTFPRIPSYRPADIAQRMDIALCQIYGMPLSTPPTLCQIDLSRRLGLTVLDFSEMGALISTFIGNLLDPGVQLQRMSTGVGARFAASLYADNVGPMEQSFAEILGAAATVLEDIASTPFPQQMCSRVDRQCPFLAAP